MTRLTLRSGRDGRLLARVVELHGDVIVTDWGERAWIEDAAERAATGGFTVHWDGRDEIAVANGPSLLRWLAHHYAARGLLVFVDEPGVVRDAEAGPQWELGLEPTDVLSEASRARQLAGTPAVPVLRTEEGGPERR